MTREQVIFLLQGKAILDTLHEKGDGIPESMVYMALGMNLQLSQGVIAFLKDAKAITVKSHSIAKGGEFQKCYDALTKLESKVKELNQ